MLKTVLKCNCKTGCYYINEVCYIIPRFIFLPFWQKKSTEMQLLLLTLKYKKATAFTVHQ